MIPSKLKNFNVFNDARSWLGQMPEIVLPKLTRQMEEYRAGGMNGPVKVDLGQGLIEAEFTLGGLMRQALNQYAADKVDGVMLRFAGAYEDDSTGTVTSVQVVMRGRYEEIDMGTAKVGDDTMMKYKMPLSYYKLMIDGETTIEIDVVNFVEVVNGVDKLQAQRLAMGII